MCFSYAERTSWTRTATSSSWSNHCCKPFSFCRHQNQIPSPLNYTEVHHHDVLTLWWKQAIFVLSLAVSTWMPDPLRLNPAKIHAILVVSIYFTRRKVSKVSTSPYPFIRKRYEWHMIIAHDCNHKTFIISSWNGMPIQVKTVRRKPTCTIQVACSDLLHKQGICIPFWDSCPGWYPYKVIFVDNL